MFRSFPENAIKGGIYSLFGLVFVSWALSNLGMKRRKTQQKEVELCWRFLVSFFEFWYWSESDGSESDSESECS